jgi:hypothetical protein
MIHYVGYRHMYVNPEMLVVMKDSISVLGKPTIAV